MSKQLSRGVDGGVRLADGFQSFREPAPVREPFDTMTTSVFAAYAAAIGFVSFCVAYAVIYS